MLKSSPTFSGKCAEATENTGDGGARVLKVRASARKQRGRKFPLSGRPQKYAEIKEKEGLTWIGK
jgi:hypothetical protein